MNLRNIFREHILSYEITNCINEEYTSNFNIQLFNTLKTYKDRVNYCQQNLQRISSGSGRIVYKIDDTKVLKLAKNKKGLAQNRTEMYYKGNQKYQDLLAQVIENDNIGLWVEMELARKVTPSIFKNYFGVTILEMEDFIYYKRDLMKGKKIFVYPPFDVIQKLNENKFVNDLMDFMSEIKNFDFGDFGRLNSYGLVNRNGQDRIVLIDFGLTNQVYDNYYS